MKKCIFGVFLAVLLLVGCDSDTYQFVEEDGNDYAIVHIPTESRDSSGAQEMAPYINFESLEEMIGDLQNGNLTVEELKEMNRMFKDEKGRVELPDLSNLYEPVLPEAFGGYTVQMLGSRYHCLYNWYAEELRCLVKTTTIEAFEKRLSVYTDFETAPVISDFSETANEVRDQLEFAPVENPLYDTSCYYIIEAADRTIYVIESYDYNYSADTPSRVYMFYNGGTFFGYFVMYGLQERPDVEWLASFEIRDYEAP